MDRKIVVCGILGAALLLTFSSCKKEKARKTEKAEGKPKNTEPALLPVPPFEAQDPRDKRAVYRLYMGGKLIGNLIAEERFAKDEITSSVKARMTLERMGNVVSFLTLEEYKERSDGTPVSFSVTLDQGLSKTEISGSYKEGFLHVKTPTGDKKVQYDPQWLFPHAISRLVRQKGYKPGTTYTFMKFQPQLGITGVSVNYQVTGDRTVQFLGKPVSCHQVKITAGMLPTQESCVDDNGIGYTMTSSMGMLKIMMTLVQKDGPKS